MTVTSARTGSTRAGSPGAGSTRTGSARTSRGRAPEPPSAGAAAHDAEPNPESVARAIALRLLTAAPRSRVQLEAAMARKGVPPEVTARVLDRYEEVGLVDDAAYAEMLVRSRQSGRGLARRALAHELRSKGVPREVAESALGAVDAETEAATARELLRRRLAATESLEPQRRRRRLAAMLARKGYGADVARRAIEEVLGEERSIAEEDV